RRSYNLGLIRAAEQASPPCIVVTPFDLAPLPFYNEDVKPEEIPSVAAFKAAVAAADALLIATPEYNHAMPGLLKNAIDWASVPRAGVLRGKPVAIVDRKST